MQDLFHCICMHPEASHPSKLCVLDEFRARFLKDTEVKISLFEFLELY